MTIAAFVVSLCALSISLATFVFNWTARAERAAESVSVRLDLSAIAENVHGVGEAECCLVVKNNSGLPVNDVAASLFLPSRQLRYVASTELVLPGEEVRAIVTKVEACDIIGMGSRVGAAVEFMDGKGRRWLRDAAGQISRISPLTILARERKARRVNADGVSDAVRWHGVWYQVERQADGTDLMVARDDSGVEVEFSFLR